LEGIRTLIRILLIRRIRLNRQLRISLFGKRLYRTLKPWRRLVMGKKGQGFYSKNSWEEEGGLRDSLGGTY